MKVFQTELSNSAWVTLCALIRHVYPSRKPAPRQECHHSSKRCPLLSLSWTLSSAMTCVRFLCCSNFTAGFRGGERISHSIFISQKCQHEPVIRSKLLVSSCTFLDPQHFGTDRCPPCAQYETHPSSTACHCAWYVRALCTSTAGALSSTHSSK